MVGAGGFEPPTSWSRTKRATKLRYAPTKRAGSDLADLFQLAIEKLGARAEPCPEVSALRRSIWELGRREFPELNISEPGEVSPSQY